jgi:rhodanese-related sulfurtransferase
LHLQLSCGSRLAQLGYENVAIYPGGKQEWMDAGFPVDRGEALAA